MTKTTFLAAMFAVLLPLKATAAELPPLVFSGIDENTKPPESSEFRCQKLGPTHFSCRWAKGSYGGVVVEDSYISSNSSTRALERLDLVSRSFFETTAVAALTQKYGKPTSVKTEKRVNKMGGPYEFRSYTWASFARNAAVYLTVNPSGNDNMLLSISFPANRSPNQGPIVDF